MLASAECTEWCGAVTLFEYLSVAISLVLSLSVVRLLNGVSVSFASTARYLPHGLWIIFVLLMSAIVWWNFWSFRDVGWNFYTFVWMLLTPAAVFLMSAALVPDVPSQVLSWKAHFFAARQRFFFALAVFLVVIAVNTWLLLGLSLLSRARIVQAIALGIAIAGASSENRRLHSVLPVVAVAIMLAAGVFVFLRPGSLAVSP